MEIEIFKYIAMVFICWEIYILINPTLINEFIKKESKQGYTKFGKYMLSAYIIYSLLGMFLINFMLFGTLLLIGMTVDFMLNISKLSNATKRILLKLDSIVSIIILYKIITLIIPQY